MMMMCARVVGAVRLRVPYAAANGQLRFRVLQSVGADDRHRAPTRCEGAST